MLEQLQRDWWLYLLLGIGLIVLGIVCISLPFRAALAINVLVGVLLVIGAVILGIYAFKMPGATRKLLGLLLAILYLVIGLLLLSHPLAGVAVLTLMLAAFFLIEGGFRIMWSLEHRDLPSWGWGLVGGILSIILGILIWAGWPSSAIWAIGLIVGIDLIFSGWTMVMLGFGLHALRGARPRFVEQH